MNCFFSVSWSHTCVIYHDVKPPLGHCRWKHTRCVQLKIFLIGVMIQISLEIWIFLVYSQDFYRAIKEPLGGSLIYFAPFFLESKEPKMSMDVPVILLQNMYMGPESNHQNKNFKNSDSWSGMFHFLWLQLLHLISTRPFGLFFFNATLLTHIFFKERETASRSNLTFSTMNQWQWRISLETVWFSGLL